MFRKINLIWEIPDEVGEMTQQFPLLFTPFQLGKYTLQSRIVVTGHGANFLDSRMPNEDYGYYLRERAKGGAGMVTLGNSGGASNQLGQAIELGR